MPMTGTLVEILKTVHYLVWSRQREPCELQGGRVVRFC